MNISEQWIAHSNSRFPRGYGGIDVNGICVSHVSTNASGCISSYVNGNLKTLDLERFQMLQKCIKELEQVLPHIDGEAYIYFSRLHDMCVSVTTETEISSK